HRAIIAATAARVPMRLMRAVQSCRRGTNSATNSAAPAAWKSRTNAIARRTTETMSGAEIKRSPPRPGLSRDGKAHLAGGDVLVVAHGSPGNDVLTRLQSGRGHSNRHLGLLRHGAELLRLVGIVLNRQ